jgi:hypothetical protein
MPKDKRKVNPNKLPKGKFIRVDFGERFVSLSRKALQPS